MLRVNKKSNMLYHVLTLVMRNCDQLCNCLNSIVKQNCRGKRDVGKSTVQEKYTTMRVHIYKSIQLWPCIIMRMRNYESRHKYRNGLINKTLLSLIQVSVGNTTKSYQILLGTALLFVFLYQSSESLNLGLKPRFLITEF